MHELHQLYFAMSHGILVNTNGGYHQQGISYGMDVKLIVAAKCLDHKERLNGMRPSIKNMAVGGLLQMNKGNLV